MSCNVGAFIDCPAIQETLINQFNGLTGVYHEPSPLLEWITSPQNTANVLQRQIDTGNSKIRQVELVYESRDCESIVTNNPTIDCTGGAKTCEDSKLYDIDETSGSDVKWNIELSDLVRRCQSDSTYFANQLMKKLDVLERAIATKTWTEAALLFGKFPTTGNKNPISGATMNNAGVRVDDLIRKVKYQYMQMDYQGAPVLFGGSEDFFNYWDSAKYACCNSTLGYNLGALLQSQTVLPFYDRKAESALGADEILAMAPGSLQLLTFNKFRGEQSVMSQDTYKQGTIMSPRTGLVYDYMATFTCGVWKFQLSLAHQLVTLPEDLFQSCDRMTGVTWVNNFKIVNPEVCACPA